MAADGSVIIEIKGDADELLKAFDAVAKSAENLTGSVEGISKAFQGTSEEVDDVADSLENVDGSGLDDASMSAEDLEASAGSAAGEVESMAGSLDGVDGGGLDDAAGSASDLESNASGAASAAEEVAAALDNIDGSGLEDASSSAQSLTDSLLDVVKGIGTAIGGGGFDGLKTAIANLPISKAALGFTGLAAGAVAAGSAIVGQVSNVAEYGDNIDKMSQKLGISATAYQEWDAILQHSGTSIDSFGAAMKTLANAAADGSKSTTEAFEKIGLSMEEVGRLSQEDLFATVVSRLQQMEEGTERTAIGADLLGRGITELGPLLNTSAEDTEAMRQAVHDLGGVMSDDAVKGAAQFQDSLQDMKTAIGGVGRDLLTPLLSVGSEVMNGISSVIVSAKERLTPVFDNIGQSMDRIKTAFQNVFPPEVQSAITGFLSDFSGALIALPFQVVAVGVEIVTTAFELIITAAGKVADFFTDTLPNAFESVGNAIDAITPDLGAFSSYFQQEFETMNTNASKAFETLRNNVTKAWDNLKSSVSSTVDKLRSDIEKAWDNIKSAISKALDNIKSTVKSAWDNVKSTVTNVLDNIKSTVTNVWNNIKTTITNAVNNVKSGVSTVFENIKSTISNTLNAAKSTALSVFESIKSSITDKINAARDAVQRAIDKIKSIMNFSWSLPHLKLPHISISGRFSLDPPSVPRFSISWYKNGGVMMNPTIFGMAGGTLLGGGEAGPEAIAPISVLQDYIEEAVIDSMAGFASDLKTVVEEETEAISAALGNRANPEGGSVTNTYGGTTINIYVDGSKAETPQQARDLGRELGGELNREMRRRGLVPA